MPGSKLICIVDDDPDACQALSGLVRSLGYGVAEFPDAESFLASGHSRDAVCVITDMRMPGMSGLQLHARLKASSDPVPVILLTAFLDVATKRQAEAVGLAGCFSKPADARALLACIEQAVRTPGTQPPAGTSSTNDRSAG